MKYLSSAGVKVDRPGMLVQRAGRMGRQLLWPAVGAFGLTFAATIARLLGPLVVAGGIDAGIVAADKAVITRAALAYLGLLLVQYVAARWSQLAVARVGERFLMMLRSRLFAHLMRLDMGFYDRASSGVLVSRMTSDVEAMTEFVNEGAVLALTNLLTTAGVAVVIVVVDPPLALAVFAVIAVMLVVSTVFQRQVATAYQQVREGIGRVLAGLQEGISGVRVVQAFTQESAQASDFGLANQRYLAANMQAARAISWYFPVVAFLRVASIGLVLLLGGNRVLDGGLTIGELVALLLYLNWFFEPIINLANVYNLFQAALAGLGKVFSVLDEAPAVVERPAAVALAAPLRGELRLDRVTFGYGDDPVLEDATLEVPAGQRLAVVGETGAGKSTIAKLLMRFYDPDRGTVTIDGVDLRDLTFAARAGAMTLIPQDGFLFNGTLGDNLRYGSPEATDGEIMDVFRAMGSADWLESLPDGLDTRVQERGSRFSAGERQLVALGRAFLADPGVVVLDEATSNLDPESEVRVEGALRVLLAGRTAVVIAHRLRSAQRADRVVMVDAGRIVADGSHDDLVATQPGYRHLVEVWERGQW